MSLLTIIIPCYNEEARLLIDDFRVFLKDYQENMLFVNDGSKDGTMDILLELEKEFPSKVNVLDLKKNVGKGEAIRHGVLFGTTNRPEDMVGFMDADLATPFVEINKLVNIIRNSQYKMVAGCRITRLGANVQRFMYRHYLSRIYNTVISNYLEIPLYDSLCGAKFFNVDFAHTVFTEPFVTKWLFDVEIYRRIAYYGMRADEVCYEMPLQEWIERRGSKFILRDILKLPWEFFKILNHFKEKNYQSDLNDLYGNPANMQNI